MKAAQSGNKQIPIIKQSLIKNNHNHKQMGMTQNESSKHPSLHVKREIQNSAKQKTKSFRLIMRDKRKRERKRQKKRTRKKERKGKKETKKVKVKTM